MAAAATSRVGLRAGAWAVLAVATAFVASVLAGALATTALPVLLGITVTRAAMDVASVTCVGAGLAAVLVPGSARARSHRAEQAVRTLRERVDRVLVATAAVWIVAVLVGIVFRTADATGRTPLQVDGGWLLAWTTRLAAGRGMALTAGCALVVLVCAAIRLRDRTRIQVRIPLVAALLGALIPTVTGHAGTAPDHELAVVGAAMHVGAAALWVGGLAALLLLVAPDRELLDAAVPQFSRLAAVCLVVVGLTGVLNAAVRLASLDELVTTGYGLLVVAKTVGLVGIGLLGATSRQRLRAGRLPVLRWAAVEVTLMAVTIGLAAALTQTGGT